jgi:hypothetical protein
MIIRRCVNLAKTLERQSAENAACFKKAAEELPQGTARELLLLRARQEETASHLGGWLQSPGLQTPK